MAILRSAILRSPILRSSVRSIVGTLSAGSMSLSGETPTATISYSGTLTAGSLAIAADNPSAIQSVIGTLSSGAMALAADNPSGIKSVIGTLTSGEVALDGNDPSAILDTVGTLSAGSVSLSGGIPTAISAYIGTLTAGSLALAAENPSSTINFPDSWRYKCQLTVNSDVVYGSGTHSQFPVLVTHHTLPSSIFTNANSDGSDIRFSSDSSGTTPLNRKIVVFDATNEFAEIHVERDLSTSSDTDLWVWYGQAAATEPSASDTDHGSQGVWDSSYKGVWDLGSTADSTANGHTLTAEGSPSADDGFLGSGYDFTGTEDLYAPDNADFDFTTGITLEAVAFRIDNVIGGNPLIDKFYDGSSRAYLLWTGAASWNGVVLDKGTIQFYLGVANGTNQITLTTAEKRITYGWPQFIAAHWDNIEDTMRVMHALGGERKWAYEVPIAPAVPYASNPIIALGTAGQWDDTGIRDPDFLRNKSDNLETTDDDGNYVLFYRGYDGTDRKQGRATKGADWKSWTKDTTNNPILSPTASTWDEDGLAGMSAIKIDADTYVAVYMGFNSTEWGVGRATSSDGKTWTKDTSTGKALSPSDFSGAAAGTVAGIPYIWYEGNTLYLCFEAYVSGDIFSIFLAHSSDDGESWTVDNSGDPILSPSATTWFADEHVANPSIYKIDTNEYLMCFNGAGNVGSYKSNYHLGFAKATSVTGPWTIFSGVALAPDGSTGNWAYRVESMRPVPSHLVKRRSDPIEFVYFGNDIDSGIQGTEIGHAEMDPNTVQWTLSATTASKSDNIGTNTLPMYIGRDYNDDDHSKWSFEDIRTSSVARSTDWIHTRAANLFGGSDFITTGTPVVLGGETGTISAGQMASEGNAPSAIMGQLGTLSPGSMAIVGQVPQAVLCSPHPRG